MKFLFISIFSCWFSFFQFYWLSQYLFGVFNFNCSFCFCFVCVWEKVNPSFVCWAIAQTKTHATCKWDHLWNDGLWIKSTLMPTSLRVASSKVLILLGIPTWGVGYPPHVMTKLTKDENFISLIWASEVCYATCLRDVWDSQNWTRSSSKKEHEKEIIWFVNHHELKMIHGW